MPFKDPEKEREYRRQYRLDNKERIAGHKKKWREKNQEYDHLYYESNRCLILDKQLERYYKNRESFLDYQKEYRKTLDPDKVRQYKAEYMKRRKREDPAFAILLRLRRRLTRAISVVGGHKTARTIDLVGCSLNDLQFHLEACFSPGMSWDNRHLWEIDHIRPCSSFDLTNEEEQRTCFHWNNLQPLWREDNRQKGKRLNK